MKAFLALLLMTSAVQSFSQDKIPAVDINNPPPTTKSAVTATSVEETAPVQPMAKANGCTMDFSNVKSLFIQDKKLYKQMTPLDIDTNKQTLKQGAIIANGIEVKFAKSACTNYAIVLSFKPKKVQSDSSMHLFRQTLTLLTIKDFQLDNSEFATLSPLIKSLVRNNWDQIKEENGQFILPCVGAKCTLRTIKEGGVDTEIELTYDTKMN